MKNLNKATLIGNVVKDPELKYTPQGTAVVSFSVATNRDWKDTNGDKKEEATFHRLVAWSKLAEIISQYVVKGSKVYVEGRISNRTWKDQATGVDHYMTEIVADELILLDNKKTGQDATPSFSNNGNEPDPTATVQNEPENEEMPF
ncbi:MAG: single-stranded DNA-binding protein [Candidatus Paceibacterota bacterium]|jgi:single-strand DNA-binding protein